MIRLVVLAFYVIQAVVISWLIAAFNAQLYWWATLAALIGLGSYLGFLLYAIKQVKAEKAALAAEASST